MSTLKVNTIVQESGDTVNINDVTVNTKLDVTGAEVVGLPPSKSSFARLVDQKGSGVDGGSSVVGVQTRVLNTKEYDPDEIVTLSSNEFTLQAGEYVIAYSAPAFGGKTHQAMLYSVTDSIVKNYGASVSNDSDSGLSIGSCVVTIAVPTTYTIQHRVEFNRTAGKGQGLSTLGSSNNIYCAVDIEKIGGVDPALAIVTSGEHFTWNPDDFGQPTPAASQAELDRQQEERDQQEAIKDALRNKLKALGLTAEEMSVLGVPEEDCK